jgi:DNA-binding transcriptional regulator YiaG
MMKNGDEPSFFEELKEGLEAGIQYARGRLSLRTTSVLPQGLTADKEEVIRLRKQLGMTQKQLALVLDVSVTTLRRWEKGTVTPTPDQLLQVRSIAAWAAEKHPSRRVASRSRPQAPSRPPKPRKDD